MLRRRVVLAFVVSALAAALPSVRASVPSPQWSVGPVQSISGTVAGLQCDNNGDDSAPLIAVDPRNQRHLAVTYFADNATALIAASSFDGGATWQRQQIADDTTCSGGSSAQLVDSGLLIRSDGRLLSSAGWVNNKPSPTATNHELGHELTNSSAAVGRPFSAPVDVEPQQPDQRGFMTEMGGRVYLETERFEQAAPTAIPGLGGIEVLSSIDGSSWTPTTAQPSSVPLGHQPVAGGIVAVGSTLVAVWADVDLSTAPPSLVPGGPPLPATITAATSPDGGATWSAPRVIASCAGCTLPRTAAGPDGTVLVSWENQATDGAVQLARSTDAGTTWTISRVAPPSHVGYGLTAAATDRLGTIVVLHERAVSGGSGQQFQEVVSTSSDDGHTWQDTAVSPVMDLATYTDSPWDGALGAMESIVPVSGGFLVGYTAVHPAALVDGQSDVVLVRLTRR